MLLDRTLASKQPSSSQTAALITFDMLNSLFSPWLLCIDAEEGSSSRVSVWQKASTPWKEEESPLAAIFMKEYVAVLQCIRPIESEIMLQSWNFFVTRMAIPSAPDWVLEVLCSAFGDISWRGCVLPTSFIVQLGTLYCSTLASNHHFERLLRNFTLSTSWTRQLDSNLLPHFLRIVLQMIVHLPYSAVGDAGNDKLCASVVPSRG